MMLKQGRELRLLRAIASLASSHLASVSGDAADCRAQMGWYTGSVEVNVRCRNEFLELCMRFTPECLKPGSTRWAYSCFKFRDLELAPSLRASPCWQIQEFCSVTRLLQLWGPCKGLTPLHLYVLRLRPARANSCSLYSQLLTAKERK